VPGRLRVTAAVVLTGDILIPVSDSPAVIDVVMPVFVADIGAIERVVAIDVDINATAAPSPVAGTPDGCADDHAGGKDEARRIDIGRRVDVIRRRRVPPVAVHHGRVVGRDVHHLRLRRFDDIDLLAALQLGSDDLLFSRLQVAGSVGARPQALYAVHHLLLLGQESVAQLLHPVEVVAHLLQDLRHCGQGPDRRIPGLLAHRSLQRRTADPGIGLHPARCLDDFERIGGRHQHLRQKRIRVEGDRRQQAIEILLREGLGERPASGSAGRRGRRRSLRERR
jgi:hypothetical protein